MREAHVAKIKEAVESREYRINYEKTAEKMMDYWSGKES
ncbi:flagellar biosynthesis anti-sigma factor FlgM [Virgibacillus salexigens]